MSRDQHIDESTDEEEEAMFIYTNMYVILTKYIVTTGLMLFYGLGIINLSDLEQSYNLY